MLLVWAALPLFSRLSFLSGFYLSTHLLFSFEYALVRCRCYTIKGAFNTSLPRETIAAHARQPTTTAGTDAPHTPRRSPRFDRNNPEGMGPSAPKSRKTLDM